MIMVTSPGKPFQYTAKGTPRRKISLKAYEEEIEALYVTVEKSSQTDLAPPREWNTQTTLEFVATAVENVMKRKLGNEDDMFQQGCDRYLYPNGCVEKRELTFPAVFRLPGSGTRF